MKKMSMLKVMNLVSLKFFGSFRDLKVKKKQMVVSRQVQLIKKFRVMSEFLWYVMKMILFFSSWFRQFEGGAVQSQIIQMMICMKVQRKISRNCRLSFYYLRWKLVGILVLNIRRTRLVFIRMQEMQSIKLMLKVGWRRRYVQFWGSSMKNRELEKQQSRENRRRQESFRLVVLTMGVLRNLMKIFSTKFVRKMFSIVKRVSAILKGFVYDRNLIFLVMQEVWFLLDQKLSGYLL